MSLTKYKQKRSFDKSPEPTGGQPTSDTLHFVVQKHHASHLHYDFRLELRGILKSWAVPKGPSMNPGEKRLAMLVEDHPWDYRDFEGIIPSGYGAGTVIVWDEGKYETTVIEEKDKKSQEHSIISQFWKGEIKFTLHGHKIKGDFKITRAKDKGENAWYLLKLKDKYATTKDITAKDKSVKSKKTLEQVAEDPEREWQSHKPSSKKKENPIQERDISSLIKKGRKSAMPANISPMLCTLVKEPFNKEGWLYEVKWDGYRVVSFKNKNGVTLKSRSGIDYSHRYTVVRDAIKQLKGNFVIDGEVVAYNKDGEISFDAVQKANPDAQLAYYVFDIVWYNGLDIAMLASFWGLFCTIGNSSFNFKSAKRNLEKSKNNFYTFIQTELLPLLNQSVSSSVHSLNENLVRFNDNFSINLNRLTGMLNKNHDALIAQERILQSLDNINITEFAKANVIVLKQLKMGTEQLEKFSEYLNSLNFLAAKTSRLATSFDDVLSRTNNFQGLAEKLDSRVDESNKLVKFLNDHFYQLDERGQLIKDSVVKVEDIMIKSLNQLEEHTQAKIEAIKQNEKNIEDVMLKSLQDIEEYTQAKIEAIKQIANKEEDLLSQSFAENRSHISKLSLLENLKDSVEVIKVNSASQIGRIKEDVESLKISLDKSNNVLEEINSKTKVSHIPKLTQLYKRIFASRKKQDS